MRWLIVIVDVCNCLFAVCILVVRCFVVVVVFDFAADVVTVPPLLFVCAICEIDDISVFCF